MPEAYPEIVLVQPDARGRLSGGYLYNAHMAAGGVWRLLDVDPLDLATLLNSTSTETLLLDSIWLTPESFPLFEAQERRGKQLGVVLHSLPSMIEATEAGQPPPTLPTEFEWQALRSLDFIGVPGPHFEQMLGKRGIATNTLAPGIDDAWRRPPVLVRDAKGCRLVSVGAVTPRKGFLDVAEALSQLPESDWSWSVLGSLEVDPGYAAQVKKFCSDSLLSSRVEFLGQLPPEEVRKRVQTSDLLVMPSYDENHPLVLLEAIASGVPALAYEAGAAAHILGCGEPAFEGGPCGVTLPIGDKLRLARELAELVKSRARRVELARGCMVRTSALPNWEQAAQRARATLADAISHG